MSDDGFFSATVARGVKPRALSIPRCDECRIMYSGCTTPKMPRDGQGKKRILIVAEAPGAEEDELGAPLVGKSGQFLSRALGELGIDMRRDCWLTNAARCRPPKNDLTKFPTAVECCRPYVLKDIEETQPQLILLLGGYAVKSVVGHLWGKDGDVGGITRWAGTQIPAHKNFWVCPTYHPSYVCRQLDADDPFTNLEFRRHLRDAVSLLGTVPWPEGPPDYPGSVEPIFSPEEAARRLARYTGGTIAFDYESNALKPQDRDGELVCASVCWEGEEVIAFPWHSSAIPAMKRLLTDPRVGKIMQNAPMELGWTREKLGVEVANVVFDTMLGAHAINPRDRWGGDAKQKKAAGGVTGLKYMAFAYLGCPIYNEHLDMFLAPSAEDKSRRGGYATNRVRDIDRRQLLVYCGADSLLTYNIADILMAELGLK